MTNSVTQQCLTILIFIVTTVYKPISHQDVSVHKCPQTSTPLYAYKWSFFSFLTKGLLKIQAMRWRDMKQSHSCINNFKILLCLCFSIFWNVCAPCIWQLREKKRARGEKDNMPIITLISQQQGFAGIYSSTPN